MEHRKEELYSQVIPAGKRRYFFDVKETRGGDKFITITESRRIFDNNTGEFQKGLENALSFIETGIEPEPVVVDSDFSDNFSSDEQQESKNFDIDDIDFKF